MTIDPEQQRMIDAYERHRRFVCPKCGALAALGRMCREGWCERDAMRESLRHSAVAEGLRLATTNELRAELSRREGTDE